MSNQVVTRFAPSPTGYLHIGGARTALFNWLYARGRGGKFLLRIEDTDRERHNEAAVTAILNGLSWLGIDWDDEPISQYARRDRHVEIAHHLLANGFAYKCYLTSEETDALRTKAREDKVRFESPWRENDPSDTPDRPFTIRFKAPQQGETQINDAIQGVVTIPNSAMDDLILVRSDGAPTYNLAVVVDDHDMAVTHIVRGDDHLNNAARQTQIYSAMGWNTPVFAHAPLIHGADGAKLSKRHGALGVEAYQKQGFLPEGLMNYLIRLGWSHGDEEIIPRKSALKWFDIENINKAPSRLDLDKLAFINKHYMRELDDADFLEKVQPFLEESDIQLNKLSLPRIAKAVPFLKERSSTLADVPAAATFITLTRPIEISGKAAKPLRKEGALDTVKEVTELLSTIEDWTPERLENELNDLAARKSVGFGSIGGPVRAALTGGAPSPNLADVLYCLGKTEALARMTDAID